MAPVPQMSMAMTGLSLQYKLKDYLEKKKQKDRKDKKKLLYQDVCEHGQSPDFEAFNSALMCFVSCPALNKLSVTPAPTPDEAIWPNMFSAKKSCFALLSSKGCKWKLNIKCTCCTELHFENIKMFCF